MPSHYIGYAYHVITLNDDKGYSVALPQVHTHPMDLIREKPLLMCRSRTPWDDQCFEKAKRS